MKLQDKEKIIRSYNNTASYYATQHVDEFFKKHFDCLLLKEFAAVNKHKGLCADFGCGPGQTTKFLYDRGIKEIIGIDISSGMIDIARDLFPELKFKTGDFLKLFYKSDYFASGIAFYAIVHFTYEQNKQAFKEINRVLKKGAQFLFSFHVGEETLHFDKVNDIDVDIDLNYFQTEKILELILDVGFRIIDVLERHPYESSEYPSRRAYIWIEKK